MFLSETETEKIGLNAEGVYFSGEICNQNWNFVEHIESFEIESSSCDIESSHSNNVSRTKSK